MLTPVNEINKVNPYIVSYLIACYKYVITLTFITLSDVYCLFFHYYSSKNMIYELLLWDYNIHL